MLTRRDLIRLGAMAVAYGASQPFSGLGIAKAQGQGAKVKRLIHIQLRGGADPTIFCVPAEGYISGHDPASATIIKTGGQGGAFAVPPNSHWTLEEHRQSYGHLMKEFFEKHGSRTLQFDGVRNAFSVHEFADKELQLGSPTRTNYPNVVSLAAHGQTGLSSDEHVLPAILSLYASTADLVPFLKVPRESRDRDLAHVLAWGGGDRPTLAQEQRARIQTYADARAGELGQGSATLEAKSRAFASQLARSEVLEAVSKRYAELRKDGIGHSPAVVLAGLAENVTLAGNLAFGGFDTHGDHFRSHPLAVGQAFSQILLILGALERLGLSSSTTVLISTEFSRTPFYGGRANPKPLNSTNGKDHGLVGTFFVISDDLKQTGRFGGYSEWFEPLAVDPRTLLPSLEGVTMRLPDLHQEFRRHFGVSSAIDEKYRLESSTAFELFRRGV